MKNMKRNVQQGFTLIELMIVIAIVAILVALAVPAYQDYTIRSKVAECINGAAVQKLAISEFQQTTGSYPADTDQAGIGPSDGISQYCSAAQYTGDGTFTVTATQATIPGLPSGGLTATLTPTVNSGGGVDWECTNASASAATNKYLPATCRS